MTVVYHSNRYHVPFGTDQMRAIVTTLETYEGMEAIGKALDYCIRQKLYSAADFRMAVKYFAQTDQPAAEKNGKATVPGNAQFDRFRFFGY